MVMSLVVMFVYLTFPALLGYRTLSDTDLAQPMVFHMGLRR
jgi:hypothetical protein